MWNISSLYNYNKGNTWSPTLSRPSLYHFQWTLPFPSSKANYYQTLYCPTGPQCQSNKSSPCQSSVLIIPTFRYFEHIHGAAMGSPISLLIGNLFMKMFEAKTISSVPHVPRFWLRYMDDPFIFQQAQHSCQFLQHINSIDPYIQFTTENPKDDCSIPFLDALVSPGPNNILTTSLYRKPSHTDQHLHLDSNHNLLARYNMYNTLAHRVMVVCISQPELKQEEDHIRQALLRCNYPS